MPSFQAAGAIPLSELSALQLAYIGDAVYDLLVRSSLLRASTKLRRMHLAAVSKVRASAQAMTLTTLLPHLREQELDYVRRGRNANSHHQPPKGATAADYSAATGLECLLGYLYVTGQEERIQALFDLSMNAEGDRD